MMFTIYTVTVVACDPPILAGAQHTQCQIISPQVIYYIGITVWQDVHWTITYSQPSSEAYISSRESCTCPGINRDAGGRLLTSSLRRRRASLDVGLAATFEEERLSRYESSSGIVVWELLWVTFMRFEGNLCTNLVVFDRCAKLPDIKLERVIRLAAFHFGRTASRIICHILHRTTHWNTHANPLL